MSAALGLASFPPAAESIFALLLDATGKGLLILIAAGTLSFAMRRASAASRHLVWSVVLGSLLMLPLLSLALPAVHIPLPEPTLVVSLRQTITSEVYADIEAGDPAIGPQSNALNKPSPSASSITPTEADLRVVRSGNTAPQTQSDLSLANALAQTRATRATNSRPPWITYILATWAAGAIAILGWLFLGAFGIRRVARRSAPVETSEWLAMIGELSERIGGVSPIQLLKSVHVNMPLTYGVIRPKILLPEGADQWNVERRTAVLLHELAHVKRRDCLVHTLAHLSLALYWFNPLVWAAVRQFKAERERACDDRVLGAGARASDYAGHLLEVARQFSAKKSSSFAAVAMAHHSQLEGRLLAILDPNLNRKEFGNMVNTLICMLTICLVAPLAALRPMAYAGSPKPNTPTATVIQEAVEPPAAVAGPQRNLPSHAQPPKETSEQAAVQAGAPEQMSREATQAQPAAEPRQGHGEIEGLRNALRSENADERRRALQALSQMNDPTALDAMMDILNDPAPEARKQAMAMLWPLKGVDEIEVMKAALRDGDGGVRVQAAWALGLRKHSRTVEPLITALKDENWRVREMAAYGLSMLSDPKAIRPLIVALGDEHPNVRKNAAMSLGLMPGDEDLEPLIKALKDSSPDVRYCTADALGNKAWKLGQKGDRRALDALEMALHDSDAQVRLMAKRTIDRLRNL